MLEPHLAEIKHQEESNFDTLNPQPIQSFSMPHYTEKTRAPVPPDAVFKPA
jgi:hypothetical protein